MLKLGITGGIGSGKSVVTQILSLLDIPVYVADAESRKLTARSPVIKIKLTEAFGNELYDDNDVLNKQLLASYIFNDKKKLQIANNIIHPEVEKHFLNWVDLHSGYPIIAHEAAILFESGLNRLMDKVVMVYSPLDLRIERVMKRDKADKLKVEERINNQMADEEKARLSDYIILNDNKHSIISQTVDLINCLNNNILQHG